MRFVKLMAILAISAVPLVAGCSGGNRTGPVVGHDDIAAYVAENPNSDAGTEVEGGDL